MNFQIIKKFLNTRSENGLTLIEMLIAIVLLSSLSLVITKILLSNTRVFTKTAVISSFQTDARLTLRYLTKDFKSATEIVAPAIGQSANSLTIRALDQAGNPQDITYDYQVSTNRGTLTRRLGEAGTQLATQLASRPADPLFTRQTRNSLAVRMVFSNEAAQPPIGFIFESVLNVKSAVMLSRQQDNLTANLNSVYFLNSDSGWAVGDNATIVSYQNNSWTQISSPVTFNLNSIRILSENLGYIASNSGRILRYDGASWSSQTTATTNNLLDVSPTDLNNVYAAGGSTSGVINYFDGNSWQNQPPSSGNYPIFRSFAQGLNDKYAIGNSGSVYRQQTVGGAVSWQPVNGSPFGTQNLNGSSLVNKEDSSVNYFLWVVGNSGTILRYNSNAAGNAWSTFQSPAGSRNLNSVHFFNERNGYAVGASGTILRWNPNLNNNNGDFEQLEPPQGTQNSNLMGIYLYDNDNGWMVGSGGTRIKIGEF